jgi:hypothetical protein
MEVHHHSHTARKKWTHYFWEFFMLFLAVTLGFFVENQREHYIENKRESKYIRSIIEDLKADTAWATQYFLDQNRSVIYYDSVIVLLGPGKRDELQQRRLYYMIRMAIRLSQFNRVNDNAYEQIKNSGNLRLLHSQEIIDNISGYYFRSREIEGMTNIMTLRQQSLMDYEAKIFDGSVYQKMVDSKTFHISPPDGNPRLLTIDPVIINEFIVKAHYVKSIMLYAINFAKQRRTEAIQLIQFLEREYNLK